MTAPGEHTYAEIVSQPAAWSGALDAFSAQAGALRTLFQNRTFERIIATGCGSTHYLSMTAAALLQAATGIPAEARPASEIVLFPDLTLAPRSRTLLLAISRSGSTTETVEAARVFRNRTGGPIVVITCYGDSPLAQQADIVLEAAGAREQSIAQTRSFSSMLILAQALIALAAQADPWPLSALPAIADRLLTENRELARQIGEDLSARQFFFLGSGALHGIACEAMLKMKEMSLSLSEAYHVLEFRHGPMSMVTPETVMVGLISRQAASFEYRVLDEMRARGARTLLLHTDQVARLAKPHEVEVRIVSGLPVWAEPVLYLPVLQLMAYYRALAKGQNPDHPANLDAVVLLDPLG